MGNFIQKGIRKKSSENEFENELEKHVYQPSVEAYSVKIK